jgi:hypothetical protein
MRFQTYANLRSVYQMIFARNDYVGYWVVASSRNLLPRPRKASASKGEAEVQIYLASNSPPSVHN